MRFFALLAILFVSWRTPIALAVLHPVLTNPRIVSCETMPAGTTSPGSPCSWRVIYDWGPSVLLDMPEMGRPDPDGGTELRAVGIHCSYGNMLTGVPFRECVWVTSEPNSPYNLGHAPLLSNCHLKSTDSWELTRSSTCDVATIASGQHHSGAGPGGECILFAQRKSVARGNVWSIYGQIEPNSIANAGNRFCQKPIPPAIGCHLQLPNIIDHGTVGPNAESVVTIRGNVDCGERPQIRVVPGNEVKLAPGVMTEISVRMPNPTLVEMTSNLRTLGGTPGAHTASVVVMVSPY